jgi:hypothetical protein
MTFLKSLPRLFIILSIVWTIGFVLFDAEHAAGMQLAALAGWGLTWIPGHVWRAFGRAWIAMQPWILFWSLTDF